MSKSDLIMTDEAKTYSMPSLEDDSIGGGGFGIQKKQRLAYEEGFVTGEKAGFAEGEQKATLLTERLEKILQELLEFKKRIVDETETQVVDLAVAIARKIIIEEINTKPEIIIKMVSECLKRLQRVGTITIRINPALHDLFNEKKSNLTDIHKDIIFDVNPNVPITGPLVISQTEEVVTDIESLLSNIIKEMKSVDREHEDDSKVYGVEEPDGTTGN